MLLTLLLLVPLVGIFIIASISNNQTSIINLRYSKIIALSTSIINLFISLVVFMLYNFSSNQFQFVQEYYKVSNFDFYLGVDGISIYFVLLTTVIIPASLLSNWSSISENVKSYLIIILLLETLLIGVFIVLDIFLFYIFFESILPPLFLLIGIFGSSNRVRASFYLFLYTLLGSLFLLLSILTISSIMGTTDFDALYKTNFNFYAQILLFIGIFIAFAVKTPTIFLNTWLLKAHVESPLGGSIILAGIVLKLSLYGILRLILPLLPKTYIYFTPMIYVIGVITIIYASLSTLRTIDIKELIAYSSVSHAAVYLLGVFSSTIQGIEGGILLGLGHGFVSSGLFICAGGILYDRSSTRLITFYRGIAQVMPLFSVLFFILCLGNAGTPLSLNFIGEFMSLYGTFERLPLLGIFASSSIVFSAAYTIYMFNRISFGGTLSNLIKFNIPDLNKREFNVLLVLIMLTVILGVYPSPLLDGLHYSVSSLIHYDASPGIETYSGFSLAWIRMRLRRSHSFATTPLKSAIQWRLFWNLDLLAHYLVIVHVMFFRHNLFELRGQYWYFALIGTITFSSGILIYFLGVTLKTGKLPSRWDLAFNITRVFCVSIAAMTFHSCLKEDLLLLIGGLIFIMPMPLGSHGISKDDIGIRSTGEKPSRSLISFAMSGRPSDSSTSSQGGNPSSSSSAPTAATTAPVAPAIPPIAATTAPVAAAIPPIAATAGPVRLGFYDLSRVPNAAYYYPQNPFPVCVGTQFLYWDRVVRDNTTALNQSANYMNYLLNRREQGLRVTNSEIDTTYRATSRLQRERNNIFERIEGSPLSSRYLNHQPCLPLAGNAVARARRVMGYDN